MNEVKKGEEHCNGDSSSIGCVEAGKRRLGGDLESSWSLEAHVKRYNLCIVLQRSLEYQL